VPPARTDRLPAMTEPLMTLRANAEELPAPPGAMTDYLEKVRVRASMITDADVEELKSAGVSEDEIFEQTVGVAIREGMRRLDAAAEAIG
jgi:alkylhydroperoxidase family enzyme